MEKRESLIILYDYYGELLKEDEKNYFEDYYFDNLSLAEIAENNNISRNAVHKHIKNCEIKLELYEEKLKLNEKDNIINKRISEIKDDNVKNIVKKIISF